MKILLVAVLFVVASTIAPLVHADAIPGDDACSTGQHWEGGHDGHCTCAIGTRGHGGEGALALYLGGLALGFNRRR